MMKADFMTARTLADWVSGPEMPRIAGAAELPWLQNYRVGARKAFALRGLPDRRHEAWRHMGLDAVLNSSWEQANEDYRV